MNFGNCPGEHIDPEVLAEFFHANYELLAPSFGYETRIESAVPWSKVPENNRNLMIAVAKRVIEFWFPAHSETEYE